MSKQVTYTCDKCGNSSHADNFLTTLHIRQSNHIFKTPMLLAQIDYCSKCLGTLNKHLRDKPKETPAAAPCVEDLFRRIVEACMRNPP